MLHLLINKHSQCLFGFKGNKKRILQQVQHVWFRYQNDITDLFIKHEISQNLVFVKSVNMTYNSVRKGVAKKKLSLTIIDTN